MTKCNIDDILAAGLTFSDTAAWANVSQRTVHRWLYSPAFHKWVDSLKTEVVGPAAALRMVELMDSENSAPRFTTKRVQAG